MIWEYEIDMPPDGDLMKSGAVFLVHQDADFEQVALAWDKTGGGTIAYGSQPVDIGAAHKETAVSIGTRHNPFTVVVRMQHKEGAAAHAGNLPWCESALKLLYQGPMTNVISPMNPMWRSQLIVIGAEDMPLQKGDESKFAYRNLQLYIAYDGPYQATVRAINRGRLPPR